MFHPSDPTEMELAAMPSLTSSDLEFIEFYNPTETELSLLDVELSGDVSLTFDDQRLSPGEYAVAVSNAAAFQERYGASIRILGQWQNSLQDNEAHIILNDTDGHAIVDAIVASNDDWPPSAFGIGASLEVRDPFSQPELSRPASWDGSLTQHGSPGQANSFSESIVINEVVSNSVLRNSIELHNTTDAPIDIGGWFLSDSSVSLQKYQFANQTVIDAGGFLTIFDSDFNPTPETPSPESLNLKGSNGGELWLTANDNEGSMQFVDHVRWRAQKLNLPWGQPAESHTEFVPLSNASIDAENAGALLGPVVVSEVHYRSVIPSLNAIQIAPEIRADDLVFLELFNSSDSPIDISNWTLESATEFGFQDGTVLSPHELLVLVTFDPSLSENATLTSAFRTHFGIDEDVNLVGPLTVDFGDNFGRIDLFEAGPAEVGDAEFGPLHLHDRIRFDSITPWPADTDGGGDSLNRTSADSFGALPFNWTGANPSPGSSALVPPPPFPIVISELMAAPSNPSETELSSLPGATHESFEFVEIYNPNTHRAIDLNAYEVSGDISLELSDVELAAGEYGVFVSDQAAFELRYGSDAKILGVFSGNLSDDETQVDIRDGDGQSVEEIHIEWDRNWPLRSRVGGASLERTDVTEVRNGLPTQPIHFSSSVALFGTPGEPSELRLPIAINELLAGSEFDENTSDSIEIVNYGDESIDISGWFLSDNASEPAKYSIPNGTTIEPGQYLLFDESDFNPNPMDPADTDFSLDADNGGQVWLFSARDGNIDFFVDEVEFSTQRDGESIGRIPNGIGQWIRQAETSLGAQNVDAGFGPILISEIHFDAAQPSSDALELDPTITSSDLEFIELFNSTDRPIDVSNWRIEGGASISIPQDTVVPEFGTITVLSFETTSNAQRLEAFRTHFDVPESTLILGGFESSLNDAFGTLRLLEPLEQSELFVEHEVARYGTTADWPLQSENESLHRSGRDSVGILPTSWSAGEPTPGSTELAPPPPMDVAITEVMYFPAAPTSDELGAIPELTSASFEYIEVFNPNDDSEISLLDYRLSGDIELTFSDVTLSPGEYAVIVNDVQAFQTRYASEIKILGAWNGELADDGLNAVLSNHAGSVISELSLGGDRRWPTASRGVGASLESRDDVAVQSNLVEAWRASSSYLGSPGLENPPSIGVIINEVSSATDGQGDSIELFNTTDGPIGLSGWRLSNGLDFENFYEFPSDSNIAAGEYLVIDQSDLIPDPAMPDPMALNLDGARGGQLWLLEMSDDSIVGFADNVEYGSQRSSQSWGRVPNGFGDLLPNAASTFGSENASLALGPLLISEIANAPNDPSDAALQIDNSLTTEDLRFVELFNSSDQPIDVSNWELDGDIEFRFGEATTIGAKQHVVVLTFDPEAAELLERADALRTHYGIDDTVRIIGPATFNLRNDFGAVSIQELGESPANEPDLELHFLHDDIEYDDGTAWPSRETGESLNRLDLESPGRQPSSWLIDTPTPGVSQLDPPSPMLLPDLALWVDPLLGFNQLEFVDTHAATGRKLIRFATATANIGRGPLIIEGRDAALGEESQQVFQIIQHEDGTTSDRLAGDFIYHPTHNHVHFDDYALYNLRAITESGEPGDIVASGDKVSFCLADFSPFDVSLENAPETWVYTACESSTQGISVGWADVYGSDLDDQWIDVEDVAPGEYWLETVIDPSDRLLESDETNNTFLSKVVIGVPEYEPDFLDRDQVNDLVLGTGDKQLSDLSIHKPGDIDTFRWIAPNDGELTVDISFDRELGDIDLYIWSGAEERIVLASSTSDDESNASATTQVVKGIQYFVVVKDLEGHTHPNYQLTLDGPDVSLDEHENNDLFLSASELGTGDKLIENLTIHNSGDKDYFAWTAAETSQVLTTIEWANNEGDLDLYVYDFVEHRVHSATTERNLDTLIFDAVQGETYLIGVVPKLDELNSNYALNLEVLTVPSDRFEPNDTDRTPVEIGSGNQFVENLTIHAPFNRDFFRWQPMAAGFAEFDLSFAHDDGNLDLVIWVNGESTQFALSDDDNEHISLEVFPENEYLIEVSGRGDAVNPSYNLSIISPQAARIAGVRLGGSQSQNASFGLLDELREVRTVPWANVDQIEVKFTEDVVADIGGIQLMMNDADLLQVIDFEYSAALRIGTWTLAEPLKTGLISVTLSDSIEDPFGNSLDGDWPGGSTVLPSGDGIPGGDFSFIFRVTVGDVDGNGLVNANDLDLFTVAKVSQDPEFDLNGSGAVDDDDVNIVLIDVLGSGVGDANLDGQFNSTDLIRIFQSGEYEDSLTGNSTWASGDWNLDGEFDTNDLVVAFTFGDYVLGATAADDRFDFSNFNRRAVKRFAASIFPLEDDRSN